MENKLILKKTKDWGAHDTAIRIPDEFDRKSKRYISRNEIGRRIV